MTIRRKKLPIEALERIDDLCAEFEKRWQSGSPQTIESCLPDGVSVDERHLLLSELIVLEIDYRQRNGEQPVVEEYIARFPDNAKTIREVIGNEYAHGQHKTEADD